MLFRSLEAIPKEFASSSDEMVLVTKGVVVNKDPVIKYEKGGNITYYVKGHKPLQEAEKCYTIAASDSIFVKTRKSNSITGAIALPNIELDSPTLLIVVISIVILLYLVISSEIGDKILQGFSPSKKLLKRGYELANTALTKIDSGEIDEANLLFHEVKLIYEKMNSEGKEQFYPKAIEINNRINASYFESLLKRLIETSKKKLKINEEEIEAAYEAYRMLSLKDQQKFKDVFDRLFKENDSNQE